jgi:hypothetical protein
MYKIALTVEEMTYVSDRHCPDCGIERDQDACPNPECNLIVEICIRCQHRSFITCLSKCIFLGCPNQVN